MAGTTLHVVCASSIAVVDRNAPLIQAIERSLDAIGLVAFQLNPHYTNALPTGIRGETRDQRIAEFTRVDPNVRVLGLPEGNWVRVRGSATTLHGPHPSAWFHGAAEPRTLSEGPLPLKD